ncbi:MAG: TIR domain-containing protein [Coleofasciculus sp. C1-SOL-03]|uniref:TIR domain-containing protein n=1 Tax=Coleofasciculus sp. C1-SOL-03 TaxID=3069522 RepID=UPI003302CA57
MFFFKRRKKPHSYDKNLQTKRGLIKISGCENASRSGDVIFIHGLGGNAWSTWHPQELYDDNFWLTWLGTDLLDIGIWSFGYAAEPFKWKGATMPLFDQASNLLDWLEICDIGQRPLIFITHSLGGLVVKAMLRSAQTFGKQSIIEQTKGIVFLATPHTGSHLAQLIDNIGILARSTVSVEELKAHAHQLRELNEWYRENVRHLGIQTKVYYETKPIHGILVVDPDSANPGIEGVKPVAIADNHIGICKPNSKENQIYLGVKKFIHECLRVPLQLPKIDFNSRKSKSFTELEEENLVTKPLAYISEESTSLPQNIDVSNKVISSHLFNSLHVVDNQVTSVKPIEVFFSFASQDEKLRDELEKHLIILKRQGVITTWHNRKIGAGKEWQNERNVHLDTASVILLLISADFIASDYCWDVEVRRAMERHEAKKARVIPVILHPTDNWRNNTPFGKLKPLPKDGKPISKWGNRDEAFCSVAQGIRAAVEELAASL